MISNNSFLSTIRDPHTIITTISGGVTFPELCDIRLKKYKIYIEEFRRIILSAETSNQVLEIIRDPHLKMDKDKRMSLLKMFRRCVSLVCDTEATKKIRKTPTSVFTENYGHTFKNIKKLKKQFKDISDDKISSLSALLGEYDDRGFQGYALTNMFFNWFENNFDGYTIMGPRGAGRDIQLSSVFKQFEGDYPCDFIIKKENQVLAVGFARYDSTRGGAQSDDRTGGNSDKVNKARAFTKKFGISFKLIFLADGPGLSHNDTWNEACELDGSWSGNVRVTTLLTAPKRITESWLTSN